MFMFPFDFQFMRMVFLATVRATRSSLLCSLFWSMFDISPSKHNDGDNGMWQPRKRDSACVTSFQNGATGVQSQVAWM